jgi:DNA-binding response OmpR family regulator
MYNVDAIVVRLADEGVPLQAIARATSTPSERLRAKLREARDEGRLLDLPREDWPPGFPRDQRALQLSRRVTQDPGAVSLAMQQIFHLTATEVSLLMALIQNANVPKERISMAHRTIDVHICRIRKALAPFGIAIATLWGYGYQLSDPHRRKAMDLILSHGQGAPCAS